MAQHLCAGRRHQGFPDSQDAAKGLSDMLSLVRISLEVVHELHQQRRHEAGAVHSPAANDLCNGASVLVSAWVCDLQGATGAEGGEEVLNGHIKDVRCLQKEHHALVQVTLLHHCLGVQSASAVRDHATFGLPGRAGGEEHVSRGAVGDRLQLCEVPRKRMVVFGLADAAVVMHGQYAQALAVVQNWLGHLKSRDQREANVRSLEHGHGPGRWEVGLDRRVGLPCAQHSEKADHQAVGTICDQCHHPGVQENDVAGTALHGFPDFGVGHRRVLAMAQANVLRAPGSTGFQQTMERRHPRHRKKGSRPKAKLFCLAQAF
mmetsp:Transcript_3883/g.9281  ORF Transcript_3883/g.9281 Transcript_3883/m.9281 type:complete len:318 (+) Transcript_3883:676-1629(+)